MMKRKLSVLFLALLIALTFGAGQAMAQQPAGVRVSPGAIGDVLMFSLYDVRDDVNLRTTAWDNFLVIENTSGKWTAVHLRFRAYKKSIEVWDHVILLSPYDMFWLDIKRVNDPLDDHYQEVKIWSDDFTTLQNSGLTYAAKERFVDYLSTDLMEACGYPDDPVETQHGEIEVIGLWSLEIPPALAGVETHVLSEVVRDVYQGYKLDGVTPELEADKIVNVYDVMYALFYQLDILGAWGSGWETYEETELEINKCESWGGCFWGVERSALDCGNVLTGAFEMGDIGNGRYELQNFVVLKDFRTDSTWSSGMSDFHRDQWGDGEIVFPPTVMNNDIEIAAYSQKFPGVIGDPAAYYLNESWSSTVGPGLRDGDDTYDENAGGLVQAFNDIWSLDDVENALGKSNLWFHYFNDCFGYGYDTIVSMAFPTKHYHWFFREPDIWTAVSTEDGNWPWWEDDWSIGDPHGYLTRISNLRKQIADDFDDYYDNGEVKADSRIWDDDENLYIPPGGAAGSPNSWTQIVIPHEVNAITVGEPGILDLGVAPQFDLGHFNIHNIRLMNGMRGMDFDPQIGFTHPMYRPDTGIPYPMYPVGGIMFLNYKMDFSIVRSCLTNWHYVPHFPLD